MSPLAAATVIAPPVVERVGNLLVVRDDLVPGGTKRRVIGGLLEGAEEVVYASPACGYAQVALAHEAARGIEATIFTAKRKKLHARTEEARQAGARVVLVPHGYLSNVQAKARDYATQTGAAYLPFGLDTEPFLEALAEVARMLPIDPPEEVWSVAGSGTLTRALQRAWPAARFFAVQAGAKPNAGCATVLRAPERFEDPAREPPPFPSCTNYDAKAWRFISERASPGALFWNVAA